MSALAIEVAVDVLRSGRALEIIVYGESMWPFVRSGDRVRVDPAARLASGQLGVVFHDGHLVVHRIVELTASSCVLLGDSGGKALEMLREDVLGVVTRQWTRAGSERDLTSRQSMLLGRLLVCQSTASRRTWQFLYRVRGRVIFLRSALRTFAR